MTDTIVVFQLSMDDKNLIYETFKELTDEIEELLEIEEGGPITFTVKTLRMTKEEFENIPEFDGW